MALFSQKIHKYAPSVLISTSFNSVFGLHSPNWLWMHRKIGCSLHRRHLSNIGYPVLGNAGGTRSSVKGNRRFCSPLAFSNNGRPALLKHLIHRLDWVGRGWEVGLKGAWGGEVGWYCAPADFSWDSWCLNPER